MALSANIKSELEKICGKNDVMDQDFVKTAYSQTMIYNNPVYPDVVVLPETKEEVSAVLRLANANKITVTPRAGGTAGPICVSDGGIIIDMSKMDKFLDFDEGNMVFTVEAGITVYNVVQELRKRGYDLPLKGWYAVPQWLEPGQPDMAQWIIGPLDWK